MSIAREATMIIKDHVAKANQANTHPAKLLVLSSLLGKLFGVGLEELIPGIESKLGSKLWGLRGSADLVFSNVVFEVKVDLRREVDDAERKLIKYLQVLHEREPKRRSIGIATDVLESKAYVPVLKRGQVVDLREIGSINIAVASSSDSVLWLDSFIFSEPKIRPSAQDLRWRFGPSSPTYSIAVDGLRSLWSEVESEMDAKLKLDLWAKNMEIVYGGKPELSSFIDHTYLVTLVKLIVYLRLSGDNVVSEDRIRRALTGEYFSSYGIANLIEEDFFAWTLQPKVAGNALRLVCDLTKELLRYDFSQIDEDFFKEIYQEIVERGERHRIGEYYTPEWLVQLTLGEATRLSSGGNQSFPRTLDPACGSGTFLCNTIHMVREDIYNKGEPPDQILDFIVSNVVGVDVNPLAVIIARANYLIALGDLLQLGKPIIIPVYVADSIQMPGVKTTLAPGGGVTVYEVDADGHPIQIPKSVIVQKAVLSQVFEALKDAAGTYKARAERNEALEIFRRRASTLLSADEFEVLKASFNTIMTLVDKGLDSIWIFILNNVYAPIALTESKFDMVVGNPPWIAMRYVENKNYQDFLKDQVFKYDLLDRTQVHLFTQMETATLFYSRSSDLYLKEGGIMAFVMPRSVLTGALHHANFKQFKKPRMRLIKIHDLEDVSPLFNVPSCVLIAVRGEETAYPVLARKYSGRLPEKNVRLAEAIRHLSANDYMYEAPEIPTCYSYYYDHIKAGAAIYPRCLFFVEFRVHPTLGISMKRPLVTSLKRTAEKEPWKAIKLESNVEENFIFASLLGGDLLPFGYVTLRPIILPLEQHGSRYRLVDVDELRTRGYRDMANWLSNVQRGWEEKGTEKAKKNFPRIINAVNYQMLLTSQSPLTRFMVVYNSSGTNIVSCVIDKQHLGLFTILRASIKPINYIADKDTRLYETDNELEAHYLCAILNSNIVNDAIKPLQTRGLFGERHIHRRPFMLPVPKFDKNNHLHIKLAELMVC